MTPQDMLQEEERMRRRLAVSTPEEIQRALAWATVTAHSPRRSVSQCLRAFERDGEKRCSDCDRPDRPLLLVSENEMYGPGTTFHTHLAPEAPCVSCDQPFPCLVWTAMQVALGLAPADDGEWFERTTGGTR